MRTIKTVKNTNDIVEKGANTKTGICPDCGNKYLLATNYCVTCKKKVKKETKKKENKMIEIKEEVKIGNVILEKGDKIEVLKEGRTLYYKEIEESLLSFFSLNTNDFSLNYVDDLRTAIISAFQVAKNISDVEDEDDNLYDSFLSKMFREYR